MSKHSSSRIREKGQTILLVAVSMITILGLAALAIDVVTLYVARSEAQRAADAGALAGAQMLVQSGLTTDPCNSALAAAARILATTQAQAVAQQNNIAGQAAQSILVSFPNNSTATCPNAFGINPQVVVTLQRTGLPTFFSRIWSRAAGSVSAVATAEAYNPSNSGGLNTTGSVVPIAPRCAKPLMLPNCDPKHLRVSGGGVACSNTFAYVDPASGAITNPGQSPTGIIGEVIQLQAACQGLGSPCVPVAPAGGFYYPLGLSQGALHLCPSCSSSSSGFQYDLECCNASTPACGQPLSPDYSQNPGGSTGLAATGGQCLIHQSTGGQDSIDLTTNSPILFIAGPGNPFVGTSIQTNDHILTSDSIVTIPLYDNTQGIQPPPPGSAVIVIGYLQVFINQMNSDGSFTATVLNVSGCGNAIAGTAVQGAATSVPVRLVQGQ